MRRLALVLALSLVVTPAWGQPKDAYKKGVKAENAGDLVGALELFESILEAKRDFNTRLHIATRKKKLGRLLEAERDYEAIRTDPKADQPTIDTAASDLEDLRPRIPKLVVKQTPATTDVKIAIDGHDAIVPAWVTVNPGTHSVVATRNGDIVFKRDVALTESTTIEVLVDAPAAPVATTVAAPIKHDVAPPAPPASSQKTWGWIGVGTGVVLAGAAIGTWVYSGSLADSHLSDCNAGPCDKSRESSIRTWETVSFVQQVLGTHGDPGLSTQWAIRTPRRLGNDNEADVGLGRTRLDGLLQ